MTELRVENLKPGRFGWGSFTPDCLQRFHTVKALAVLMVLSHCCSNLEKGYLIAIAETLQTIFYLSNTQIGIIIGVGLIFVLVLPMPIAHWARNGHMGRWIGVAAALSVVSGLGFVMPIFLPKSTEFWIEEILTEKNNSAYLLSNASLASDPAVRLDGRRSALTSAAFAIFVVVQLFSSFIAAMSTLMLCYIEQNAKQTDVALYSTLITGVPILFFAAAFLMTPVIQAMHSNGSSDSLIDKWWIGFMIAPAIRIFLVLPMFGFASQLPECAVNRAADVDQCHRKRIGNSIANANYAQVTNKSNFWLKICNLFKNPIFMLITMRGALSLMVITGSTSFFMVYLQHAFGFSKSTAAVMTAVGWVLSYVVGNVIGSVVVKVCRFSVKQIMELCLSTMVISTLMLFVFMLNCGQFTFRQKHSNFLDDYYLCQELQIKANYSIKYSIHSNKMCLTGFNLTILMDPKCQTGKSTEQILHNNLPASCNCLNVLNKHFNSLRSIDLLSYPTLRPGICFEDYKQCTWKRIIFALVITLSSVIGGIGATPALQAVMLVVPSNERAVAIALNSTFNGILSSVGPVIVGIGFDSFCSAYTKSDSSNKLCIHYDGFGLSLFLYLLFLISGALGTVMLAAAVKIYKPAENPDSAEPATLTSN